MCRISVQIGADPHIQSLAKSGNHYWARACSLSVSCCQNTAEWANTQPQLALLCWLPGTALPLSLASIMSLVTFSKADSVLYNFLNPDWKIAYNELESRKECNWVNTNFSKIFEIKGRSEIGLKLLKSDSCFRQSGTVPELRHILIKKQEISPYSINNLL